MDTDLAGSGQVVVLGNLNIDLLCYPLEVLPEWGQERTVRSMWPRAAGSAGYTAMALGRLGLHPIVVGNVGSDHYGRLLLDALAAHHVDTGNAFVSQAATGVSVTLIGTNSERAFVTFCGHLEELTVEEIIARIPEGPSGGYALFSGLFLLPKIDFAGAVRILQTCRERRCKTMFDSGDDPAGWTDESVQGIRGLLKWVDVFVPNWDEACAVSGKSEAEEVLACLLKLGPELVVLKDGARGSWAMGRGADSIIQEPAYRVKAVDTTGAGDTFNAGLIYGLSSGWDLERCLAFANAAAAIAISRMNDRYPSAAEVRHLLEHGSRLP
ncbi:MAG: carbohydrate kinase family protein [Firmicutes bacterium]|nr:carbohydrate kinase family protein [Bacillota bacterium]